MEDTHKQSFWQAASWLAHFISRHSPHAAPMAPLAGRAIDASQATGGTPQSSDGGPPLLLPPEELLPLDEASAAASSPPPPLPGLKG
jgi:hypothetical protein